MYNKMKVCNNCKENKDLIEFGVRSKHVDQLNSWCKSCVRDRSRKWYKGNKEKANKKSSKGNQERRDWFNSIKEQFQCVKCEEKYTACLDFHHIDPKTKSFTIASSVNGLKESKEKILEEINKCVVLCSNCHRKFHHMEKHDNITLTQYLTIKTTPVKG
jgi:hypothetical protein